MHTSAQKSGVGKISFFFMCLKSAYKYSINSNIVKYYYNLK